MGGYGAALSNFSGRLGGATGGYGGGGAMFGGGGGGGGMVGLDQLLKLLQNMQGGGPGGMNAPNAAGAIQGGTPGGFNLNRGVGAPGNFNLGRGGGSLAPSVQGAPQVENPGANLGGGGFGGGEVAPAAAGGTVPMGNLLSLTPGQVQGRSRANQRLGQFGQGYGGGLARPQRSSWSPQGPQGPRTFAMTAR
jgi:hypothetical protein